VDAYDDAASTEVTGMTAVLIGACIGIAALLWPSSTDRRLRSLLGESDGGDEPTIAEAAPTGQGTGTGRAVADDLLAFDLDLVAICLTSGLPIPVALALTAEATGDRSGLQRIGRAMTIGGHRLADDDRLLPVLEVFEFSEHTGVGPAPLIESVASELRASSRRRRQEAAAALGVQLVLPLGVCILPAFLLLSVVPVVISLLSDLTTVFF
jgi:hypothetical protein